jgi:hypothetical protein
MILFVFRTPLQGAIDKKFKSHFPTDAEMSTQSTANHFQSFLLLAHFSFNLKNTFKRKETAT